VLIGAGWEIAGGSETSDGGFGIERPASGFIRARRDGGITWSTSSRSCKVATDGGLSVRSKPAAATGGIVISLVELSSTATDDATAEVRPVTLIVSIVGLEFETG